MDSYSYTTWSVNAAQGPEKNRVSGQQSGRKRPLTCVRPLVEAPSETEQDTGSIGEHCPNRPSKGESRQAWGRLGVTSNATVRTLNVIVCVN